MSTEESGIILKELKVNLQNIYKNDDSTIPFFLKYK